MFINRKISRNFVNKIQLVFYAVFCLLFVTNVSAKLVFVTEEDAIYNSNFTINADDSADDFVDLNFGETLNSRLRYDINLNKFIFNEDLDLDNHELLNTRIENLPSPPNCSNSVQGRIYYNTVDLNTYICNGTNWVKLDKNFSGTAGSLTFIDNSGSLSEDNANIFWDDLGKKLGIGTNNPSATLSIGGSGEDGMFSVTGNGTGNIATFRDIDGENIFKLIGSIENSDYSIKLGDFDDVQSDNYFMVESGKSYFMNGNVGVGTETPSEKLDVEGNTNISGNLRLNGAFLDKDGDAGVPGQVLSSTGTGTDWIANSGSGNAAPFITSSNIQLPSDSTQTFVITGDNFVPNSTVSIPGFTGTINSVAVLSPTEMEVNITTSSTLGTYDIIISNGGVPNTQWAGNGVGMLSVSGASWVDLRAGGDTFTHGNGAGNDIRYHAGMNMNRDANGMYFTGFNPWSSWVKFESLGWARGTNKTLQWIFTPPNGYMMIGIGSDATNESNNSQYAQAEVEAYFQNANKMWGLYGNKGTVGSSGNQGSSTSVNSAACPSQVLKIKFENDGDLGDTFTLYCLPSANVDDWDNESTVLRTMTIGGTINPDETNIMPFIIPRNGGSQRFIAVKVE